MDKDFSTEWINSLLTGMEENCKKDCVSCGFLYKKCAEWHYQYLNLDSVITPFIGNLPDFITFLEKEWGWKITVDKEHNILLVDENKDCCVCPIASKIEGRISPLLCNCSSQFAAKMFSFILKKEVHAKVNRSFIRDGKSCIYEITL